ncbi:MAG: DUF4430 domain-containing protein [Candidatus Pacebacteria bacterium]|nr:DUF4430 domain-containing protein [Candidatus Paceibacterota bacterium]
MAIEIIKKIGHKFFVVIIMAFFIIPVGVFAQVADTVIGDQLSPEQGDAMIDTVEQEIVPLEEITDEALQDNELLNQEDDLGEEIENLPDEETESFDGDNQEIEEAVEEQEIEQVDQEIEETYLVIEGEVAVSDTCTITDTNGVEHMFPTESSPSEFLGICTLDSAAQSGIIADFTIVDFGWGLFLDSINTITTTSDWDRSWIITKNGEDVMVGLTDLAIRTGDVITFSYTSYSTDTIYDVITLNIVDTVHSISVPQTCTITDTDGTEHTFPTESSPSEFLGICALSRAVEQGHISGFALVNNESFGLYVQSIDGIVPSDTEYWALWHNGSFAECGITCLTLEQGDTLAFVLTDWMDEVERDNITFIVSELEVEEENEDHPETLSVTAEVDVAQSCEVVDADGEAHMYTSGSEDAYLGICALGAALESSAISSVGLSNEYPEMGLFVTSFNDTEADPSSQYWALYRNGDSAESSISTLLISSGDSISFKLSDFAGVETDDYVVITIRSLIDEDSTNSGGSGSPVVDIVESSFDINGAITYLKNVQSSGGSFGGADLYTDWTAVAFGAGNVSGSAKSSLSGYLQSHPVNNQSVTDVVRRSMALLALGQNPYDVNGEDYIKKILAYFDGNQFGEESLINDDIFALVVLERVGFTDADMVIQETLDAILTAQKNNGSWENSIDLTSAGIQALYPFIHYAGVSEAITRAENYIITKQQHDGGWGDVFATSWAMQAGSMTGNVWTKDGKTGLDYMISLQYPDGGMLPNSATLQNRIWATAYVIPAVLEQSWSDILEEQSRPDSYEYVGGVQNSEVGDLDSGIPYEEGDNILEEIILEPTLEIQEEVILIEPAIVPVVPTLLASKDVIAQEEEILQNQDKEEASVTSIDPLVLAAQAGSSAGTIPLSVMVVGIAGAGVLGGLAWCLRKK